MMDFFTVEKLHNVLIDKFGGSKGIRDKGSLLAALARPYTSFDQQDLYPTPVEKAAAVFVKHYYQSSIYGWQQTNCIFSAKINVTRERS